tara:strand:+ start:550 stop:1479 length:930 start_codon:yes stop_codon:yes gene_type:complete
MIGNTDPNIAIITALFILSLFGLYLFVPLFLFQKRRKGKNLQPPKTQTALRGPGESLRRNYDKCMESILKTAAGGTMITVVLAILPLTILYLFPESNAWFLLASGASLCLAVAFVVIRKVAKLLDDRVNFLLGWIGECIVAEDLRKCIRAGFYVLHDVPIEGEGFKANIDHVVIGEAGVAVIETKMRSKPEYEPGIEIKAFYDGERISWPRFKNDTKTLWQVQKNAEWVQTFLRKECHADLSVKKVVAIPGWNVVEKKLGQPRVVSGKGISDAVQQAVNADESPKLTVTKVESIYETLAARCRDVDLRD